MPTRGVPTKRLPTGQPVAHLAVEPVALREAAVRHARHHLAAPPSNYRDSRQIRAQTAGVPASIGEHFRLRPEELLMGRGSRAGTGPG